MRFLLCIDDTDTPETIGTGRLARMLAERLFEKPGAKRLGITRHQLLVHPAIPYTSHNSSACMEIEYGGDTGEIAEEARRFMRDHFHPGADPGMALIRRADFSAELIGFGRDAQTRILTKKDAYDLAREKGVLLEEFGGTGEGVIGALAGLGLRGGGDDGRFIELDGIRDFKGVETVYTILSRSLIEQVIDIRTKNPLLDRDLVDTKSWVRPSLSGGRIILFVSPNGNNAYSILKDDKNGS
jgi:hypothetical protein